MVELINKGIRVNKDVTEIWFFLAKVRNSIIMNHISPVLYHLLKK